MAFRESAEREVLLQQEEEYAAELETLESQVTALDSVDPDLRIKGLTRERERLKREIGELTERRDNVVVRQTERAARKAAQLGRYGIRNGEVHPLFLAAFGFILLVNILQWLLK